MTDIVERLRSVDHESVEDCFLLSPLFAQAADEIERLRALSAHQHQGGGEAALRAALVPFASEADSWPEGHAPDDYRVKVALATKTITSKVTVGDFRRARSALAQQPLSVPSPLPTSSIPVCWQPIETAPKDGTDILILTQGRNIILVAWSRDHWDDGEGRPFQDPATHWTPLPPAQAASPAHPIQCDVSCSRAREGGTEE